MDNRLVDRFRSMDTEELEERLASGVLTKEAAATAERLLLERAEVEAHGGVSELHGKEKKVAPRVPIWFWLLVLSAPIVYRVFSKLVSD